MRERQRSVQLHFDVCAPLKVAQTWVFSASSRARSEIQITSRSSCWVTSLGGCKLLSVRERPFASHGAGVLRLLKHLVLHQSGTPIAKSGVGSAVGGQMGLRIRLSRIGSSFKLCHIHHTPAAFPVKTTSPALCSTGITTAAAAAVMRCLYHRLLCLKMPLCTAHSSVSRWPSLLSASAKAVHVHTAERSMASFSL